jgi:hypothetical protein
VYYHLCKNNLQHLCPDTYSDKFEQFYHRNIKKLKLNDVIFNSPIFIKPAENSKLFSGHIIQNKLQFDSLRSYYGNVNVYISNIINIVGEYRLLIGNNKIYGSSYMKGMYDENYLEKININKLIELTSNTFLCVDIGILENDNFVVIEINPPYSLDNYDIPIDQYMSFCIEACNYINSHNG